MDITALEARKQQIGQKFNEFEAKRSSIVTELNRLQGEYRVLNELIDNLNKKEQDGSEPGRPEEPTA